MMHLLFGFQGRIRRTNYWLGVIGSSFALSLLLVIFVVIFSAFSVAAPVGRNGEPTAPASVLALVLIFGFSVSYLVLLFWISFALQIKRWHDRDKSGVWVLIGFIPLIGPFWALIECGFMDGTPGPNQYGPSPKGLTGPVQVF